jgi:hypothetical protein
MVYEYLEEIGKANDFKDGIKFCSRPRYDHYTQKLAEREAASKKKTREDRNVPSASGVPTAGTCQAMPTRPVQDHERRKRTTTGTADRVVTLSDSYSGSRVTSHPVGESTDDDDFTAAPVSVPMAHVSRSIASRPTRPGAHHAAPISDSQATVVLATSPSATPLSSPRFRHPTPLRVDSISRQGGLVLPRGDAYADRVNETLSGNVPQDESLSEVRFVNTIVSHLYALGCATLWAVFFFFLFWLHRKKITCRLF